MRLAPDGQLFKGQELGALPAVEGEDDPEQDVEDGVEDDVEDEVPADAGRLRRRPKNRRADVVEMNDSSGPFSQPYTFFLRMGPISWTVCHWQAFPV
jgi:hypothetical protein